MTVWRGRNEGGAFVSGELRMPVDPRRGGPGELHAAIRPEDVEVSRETLEGGWPAEVIVSEPLGSRTLLTLRTGGEISRALVPPGDWSGRVWVRWPPERVHYFDGRTKARV
jgi:ABC-type sugar transport system ATPase subunit